MAFKILSLEELELLTENQRENYEKELAIYNERVKFVEQMEKFENTVIKPYEPKLTAIPAVCEVPEKEFEEPEYEFVKITPFTKPESKVAVIDFGEPIMAVVPGHTKIKNVPVGHMKNVERDKPVLPIISKAAAPADLFTKAEQQQPVLPASVKVSIPGNTFTLSERANPNLPIAVKPQNFAELFFTPDKIDSSVMTVNSAELIVPAIEVPAFAVPECVLSILPKPEAECPVVGVMQLPELTAPVLPKVIAAKQMDVSWKQTAEIKAELPETLGTTVIKVSFAEPDIEKTQLPSVLKAGIPAREFKTSEHTVSDLPIVSIAKAGNPVFTMSELEKPMVPTVVKKAESPSLLYTAPEFEKSMVPTVVKKAESPSLLYTAPEFEKSMVPTVVKKAERPSLLYTAPEFEKPMIQTVVKPTEIPKTYDGKISVNSAPEIEYPSIDVFSVQPFEKIHSKVSGLPTIHAAASPDDCTEELLRIRLSIQEEYENRKEGFA